jgi:hypothetical protein
MALSSAMSHSMSPLTGLWEEDTKLMLCQFHTCLQCSVQETATVILIVLCNILCVRFSLYSQCIFQLPASTNSDTLRISDVEVKDAIISFVHVLAFHQEKYTQATTEGMQSTAYCFKLVHSWCWQLCLLMSTIAENQAATTALFIHTDQN